jgi:hypothetical protein
MKLMNTIKSFFTNMRRKFFNWRVNREIFHRISPHLRDEANNGYSFRSKDEMVRLHIRNNLPKHRIPDFGPDLINVLMRKRQAEPIFPGFG